MRPPLTYESRTGRFEAPELPSCWPDMATALSKWCDPEVQLCWMERPPVRAIEGYLDEAVRESVLGRGWHHKWSLQQPLDLDLLPLLRGRGALVRDMQALAALLCQVAGVRHARVRFDVITGMQCPRFHIDNVKARLLCTYRGVGTQWLEEVDANPSKLGEGSGGLADEVSGLILRPDAVRTLPTFAVALLKGRLWPANPGRGAIHRSPPVDRYATPRVMVAIDAL